MNGPLIDRSGLALALSAWSKRETRELFTLASAAGYRAVTLDAAAPDTRPRSLGRSARRDLAASLRRLELYCVGVDLWIPPDHFAKSEHADRALGAVVAATGFAREIASVLDDERAAVVSVVLPQDPIAGVLETLIAAAQGEDVRIADHARTQIGDDGHANRTHLGIDPALVLIAKEDPSIAVLDPRVAAVRLADHDGIGRCEPGASGARLDIDAYVASSRIAAPHLPMTIDLRGAKDKQSAAKRVLERLADSADQP